MQVYTFESYHHNYDPAYYQLEWVGESVEDFVRWYADMQSKHEMCVEWGRLSLWEGDKQKTLQIIDDGKGI